MFFTESDREALLKEVDVRVRYLLTDSLKEIIRDQCEELVISLFEEKSDVSFVKWGPRNHSRVDSLRKVLYEHCATTIEKKLHRVSHEATQRAVNSEAFLDEIVTRILKKQVR